MQSLSSTVMYSEQEAADFLGISITRLHEMLDRHIFNDGTLRPSQLTFTNAEVILLGFWQRTEHNPKVLRMPRRS